MRHIHYKLRQDQGRWPTGGALSFFALAFWRDDVRQMIAGVRFREIFTVGFAIIIFCGISACGSQVRGEDFGGDGYMRVLNNELPVIRENWSGNFLRNGQFNNGALGDHDISFATIMRWRFSRNPQRDEKKSEQYKLAVAHNTSFVESDKDMIVWLGHSTFYIRLGGQVFVTDPVLENVPFLTRHAPVVCSAAELKGVDYILLSHAHRDHCDVGTIGKLLQASPSASGLLPLGMAPLYKNIPGAGSCQEAGWYQQFQTTATEVIFLPARHWSRRGLADTNEILWGSFLIRNEHFSIYFAGDSSYATHFKEISNLAKGRLICIMPIGAYKPSYIMQQSHMSPVEALAAYEDLGGEIFIPMHYGTFDLSDEPRGEPIRLLSEEWQKKQYKGQLLELVPGKPLMLNTDGNGAVQ